MSEDTPQIIEGGPDPDETTHLLKEIVLTMGGNVSGEQMADEAKDSEASQTEETLEPATEHVYSQRAIHAIRAARTDQGISARQLAELCEDLATEVGLKHTLTRARLAKLENGFTAGNLTVDELIIASRALGVSVGVLLGDAIMKPDEQQAAEQLRELHARLGSVLSRLPPDPWSSESDA